MALRAMDENRAGIVFVVDADRRVVGVLTDGDVRHAFVRGSGCTARCARSMTDEFSHGRWG